MAGAPPMGLRAKTPANENAALGDADGFSGTHNAIVPNVARSMLRFLTCGSVDDGKSTLIGRLLYDCNAVFDDQMRTLEDESKRIGTTGGDLDLALLVDGLSAEREQGITIDVAYRYFSSPRRSFIVADTPGHEQYTRNMATGASVSDLAIILIDARKGVLVQTRRHSCIAHLLGIRNVVLAVNKMDLVGWSEQVYDAILEDYGLFAGALGIENVVAVPLSARHGDNVVRRGTGAPWYSGPTLLEHLETIEVAPRAENGGFRLPVQWVNRPNQDFRGFSGTVAAGRIAPGDRVVVTASARETTVKRIVSADGDLETASTGDAVTLVLADEVDVSRGDILASANDRPTVADQVAAHVIWMSQEPMLPGRPYIIKCGTATATATVSSLRHKVDVESLDEVAGRTLELNEVGFCNLSFDRPLAFDAYDSNRVTGGFILIDRISNQTVAAGLIRFALRRSTNIHWQAQDIDKTAHAALKGQKPCCLWFTGLSGSGKSTIANLLEKRLYAEGRHTFILDGDNVRHGLNRDLGFTDADRVENIRRASHVAKLMVDAGLIVMVSFISPFRAERRMARELFGTDEFIEIFVDTPLEICEQRDAKGLYKKARAGQLPNFTGISSAYEQPETPELYLAGGSDNPEILVDRVFHYLKAKNYLG
jgi:bifunctional enzyme CysN/CysC